MLKPRAGHGRTSTLARCSAPFPRGNIACKTANPVEQMIQQPPATSAHEMEVGPTRSGRCGRVAAGASSFAPSRTGSTLRGRSVVAARRPLRHLDYQLLSDLKRSSANRDMPSGPPPSGSGHCAQSESGDALRNSATVGNSSPPQDTSAGQLAALADPPFRPGDHASQPASTVMPTSCAGCRCNSPRNHCLSRLCSRRSDQPRPLSGVSSTARGTGTKSLVSGLQANAAASTTFPPRSDSTT
jgi:hypothetical protein